ncbi:hypothetical protein D3C85_1809500 [compost metagenome]
MDAAEFVGGFVYATQQFTGVGQGVWGDQIAVDGEVGGSEGSRWVWDNLFHGVTPSSI